MHSKNENRSVFGSCGVEQRRRKARTQLHRVHVTMLVRPFFSCFFFSSCFRDCGRSRWYHYIFHATASVVVDVGCSSRKKASPALYLFFSSLHAMRAYVSEDMNLKLCSLSVRFQMNQNKKSFVFLSIFIFASDLLSTHSGRTTYGHAP